MHGRACAVAWRGKEREGATRRACVCVGAVRCALLGRLGKVMAGQGVALTLSLEAVARMWPAGCQSMSQIAMSCALHLA